MSEKPTERMSDEEVRDLAEAILAKVAMNPPDAWDAAVVAIQHQQRRAAPREAVIEERAQKWHPIDTAPKDGTTIEVRAVMRVHRMQDAKFAIMPRNWRPDTPQTEWRFTSWRPVAEPSEQAALAQPKVK